jgi:uncharacterized membrane protein YbhN (UPF0104 family)
MNNDRSKTTAFVAVFMERVSGIVSLLAMGFLAAVILVLRGGADIGGLNLARSVVLFGSAAIIIVLLVGLAAMFAGNSRLWWRQRKWPQKLLDVASHIHDYTRQPSMSVLLLAVSVAFHVISIGWMVLLCRAIGANLGFVEMTIIAALLSVVSILPLSINGIGLLDGSFIVLAGLFGLSNSHGLTFMLIMRAVLILISVFGAGLYILDRRQRGVARQL